MLPTPYQTPHSLNHTKLCDQDIVQKHSRLNKGKTLILERRFNEFRYSLNRHIETKVRETFSLNHNRNAVSGFVLSALSAEELPGFDTELHHGVDPSLLLISNCGICHVSMNAPTQAQQHYTGKNHAKKIRQYLERLKSGDREVKNTSCSLHNCSANVKTRAQECLPSSAAKNMMEMTPDVQNKLSPEKEIDVGESNDYCRICDVSFNSDKQAKQHYKGRNHLRRKEIGELNKIAVKIEPACDGRKPLFSCNICHIETTSHEQLKSHVRGAKHAHKLRQMVRFGTKEMGVQRYKVSCRTLPYQLTRPNPRGPYTRSTVLSCVSPTNTTPTHRKLPMFVHKFRYHISQNMDRNKIQRNQSPPSVRAP